MLNSKITLIAGGLAGAGLWFPVYSAPAENPNVRTIHLRQNDAQILFESRIYELKYTSAEEMLPFVKSAILRYNANSTIRRITGSGGGRCGALLVSTGRDFLPMVDRIVAALDRPGKVKDGDSPIDGTGMAKVAYTPQYRAAADFANLINTTIGSSVSSAYVNRETNTIFWRDQTDSAKRTLSWVGELDRPIPQVRVRLNYYELRDSDLKDWGFDYLAWKNGPGVNLLNLGYNSGELVLNELLDTATQAATMSWGFGGFFTAPQFDMSFIRCLQQSGNASVAANASLVMINTPVANEKEYAIVKRIQNAKPDSAPFIYRVSMKPEYQNIAKNTLGRTLIGKSYYEDEYGEKHADPPVLEAKIVNPFICLPSDRKAGNERGFIPQGANLKTLSALEKKKNGGVIFDYALYFKNVVERGNTGAELSNSAVVSGAATLGFGDEKILAVYEKENDVEQTVGLPILCRIPYLKYLFSTVTTIKERTYIVISAEAVAVNCDDSSSYEAPVSANAKVERRIENPFRPNEDEPAGKENEKKMNENKNKDKKSGKKEK